MLDVLGITLPIFLIILLGFVSARHGLVTRDQARGMGNFVIRFALPALLVQELGSRPISEILQLDYLLAYALASLAVFALGAGFSRYGRGDSLAGAALNALGMSGSNSGFIGYPVAVMVVGTPAALAMALGMIVEATIMVPLTLILCEISKGGSGSRRALLATIGRRLAGNPMLLGIATGLGLSLLQWPLPAVLAHSLELLARASAPLALFVIGATLHGLRPGGLWWDVGQITLGKLLLHPLAVWIAFSLTPSLSQTQLLTALLFASAPMMSIYPLIGQQYGLENRCTAALVSATALSFFSISLLLMLLGVWR